MTKHKLRLLLVCLLFSNASVIAQRPLIFSYVGGYNGNHISVASIQAKKLTHVLYAFADVYKNKAHLNFPVSDDINLRALGGLRKVNSDVKILLSVGGAGWSRNFSDMAFTAANRKVFAESCVQLLTRYKLDGIDIDWEFPGYAGEGGNKYRPEDKTSYTLLFKAMRERFDSLTAETGRRYLLSTAVDGWASHFLPHTQMDQVQKYVDYILVMAYNFNTAALAGGHFLHTPKDWPTDGSAEGAMYAFMAAGVPRSKLVLGAGFFPAACMMAAADANNRQYLRKVAFRGGLAKVNQMINKNGFTKYWDEEGQSPFLFNSSTRMRIAYEDEHSIIEKAKFIRQKSLAGLMYWDYFSDPHRQLLTAAYSVFSSP